MKIGILSGSFDLIHNGHLDIIGRSLYLLDHIVVAVNSNPSKTPIFPAFVREQMAKDSIQSALKLSSKQCTVSSYNGLITDFAKQIKANILLRGIRNEVSFRREQEQASINKTLFPMMETVF